jgi:aryl-phospho-beta-D-glucosidase BglC (GH1 family)
MTDLLDILEAHNFNAIRVPLSYEVIKHMDEPGHGVGDRNYKDPELQGKTIFETLDLFVEEAGKRGILIMFDMHQIDPMNGFDPVRRRSLDLYGW